MAFWSRKAPGTMKAAAKDPVCGMIVDTEKPGASLDHMGKTYYFCSPACKNGFSKQPGKYLGGGHGPMDGGAGHCH